MNWTTVSPLEFQPVTSARFPRQPLHHLDTLWIQVAGTLCNLECTHCFVASGPRNHRHGMMSRAEVRRRVAESLPLGVKEFYFTGGEPFAHPEIVEILADTLEHGPSTALTNGTLFGEECVARIAALAESSRYALEVRVSLDGPTCAAHDAIRGAGSFARALAGLKRCARQGLLPIVTATLDVEEDPAQARAAYLEMLRGAGIARPRLKLLPRFRIGREIQRSGGYGRTDTLADLPSNAFDPNRLQCGACRAVTSRGVFVCPLLVDEPGGRMGDRLADALGSFPLGHGACFTCYTTGMTCANE